MSAFPTNCDKCGVPFFWDRDVKNPLPEGIRKKEYGWWVERLSKQVHVRDRCNALIKSGEFKDQIPIKIETSPIFPLNQLPLQSNNNQQKLGVSPEIKVKEIDMNDLAVKAQLRHFESDMSDFEMFETFIFNRYGNINPAKAGMIIKFLEERRKERVGNE